MSTTINLNENVGNLLAAQQASTLGSQSGGGGATSSSSNFGMGGPLPDADEETATFITALKTDQRAEKKKVRRAELLDSLPSNHGGRIAHAHQELQLLAGTLDNKVGDLLNAHEKDFFLAYKTHM